jgi:hypothetical protein
MKGTPMSIFRKPLGKLLLGGCVVAIVSCSAWALSDDDSDESKGLDSLAFMVGAWRCGTGNDLLEEHWQSAAGGSMLGMCRIGGDAKRSLYEIILIDETEDGPVMSILHFKTGLKAKDKKPAKFKLTKQGKDSATFEDPKNDFPSKIIYTRTGESTMNIRLEGLDKSHPGEDFKMKLVTGG